MKNFVTINTKIKSFKSSIIVPGDKSISIRFVLLASQAIGKSNGYNLLESEDVINSIKAMKALGVKIIKKKNVYEIYGVGLNGFNFKNNLIINAGNSGTLSRILPGQLAKTNKSIKIIGDKSLSKRDFSRIIKPLQLFGINLKSKNNNLPISVKGSKFLRPISYFEKKGSAQVKSSCLFAALNTPGLTTVKSVPSRNHTELMLKNCLKLPITSKRIGKFDITKIHGGNQFHRFNYNVPGDISSAAFFIALTILSTNSYLIIKNVNINKSRTGIIEILKKMNAKIIIKNKKFYHGEENADIIIRSSPNLRSINCPRSLNTKTIDEFLIIFLICARSKGVSKFVGLEELRHKESDRLNIGSNFLKMIGVNVKETFNSLKIFGNPNLRLKGNYIVKNFKKDHRVFMMSCIAALTLGGNFKIKDKNSINSSFPNFITILRNLGAEVK